MPDFLWHIINRGNRLCGPDSTDYISVPMRILSDFKARYVLFDDTGRAVRSARNILEALRARRSTGLNVTRILG